MFYRSTAGLTGCSRGAQHEIIDIVQYTLSLIMTEWQKISNLGISSKIASLPCRNSCFYSIRAL